MDNETDHTLAFYSLDDDFVSEILHADWAVDTQFIPRDQPDKTGYARSFYQEKSALQITLILLTKNLPLLSTPKEMRCLRFRPEQPRRRSKPVPRQIAHSMLHPFFCKIDDAITDLVMVNRKSFRIGKQLHKK